MLISSHRILDSVASHFLGTMFAFGEGVGLLFANGFSFLFRNDEGLPKTRGCYCFRGCARTSAALHTEVERSRRSTQRLGYKRDAGRQIVAFVNKPESSSDALRVDHLPASKHFSFFGIYRRLQSRKNERCRRRRRGCRDLLFIVSRFLLFVMLICCCRVGVVAQCWSIRIVE